MSGPQAGVLDSLASGAHFRAPFLPSDCLYVVDFSQLLQQIARKAGIIDFSVLSMVSSAVRRRSRVNER